MDIPIPREPVTVSPWFTKFVECLFAGVAAVNGILMFLYLLPQSVQMKMGQVISLMFVGQFVLGLAAGFGFSFSWHKLESRRRINSGKLLICFFCDGRS